MPDNLNDWLGDHVWAWWLTVVVLLLGAAVVFRSRLSLGLAAGPIGAAMLALALPDRFWIQAGVAIVAGLLGGWLLTRRRVSEAAG